jgi:hypothetical protein
MAAWLALLCFPEPLFPHSLVRGNVTLRSDAPLPPAAAGVLEEARARLARSPWDDPRLNHRIFLCQTRSRWLLFSLYLNRVSGFNCVYLNRAIFLRHVNWATGRMIGPSGKETQGERDLPYYLAHEMAHGLTVKRLGRWRYFHLPAWKREGYADYVGKAHFDYGAYLAKLRAGHPRRDPAAGYYWRYELLVGYELEREGADPDRLFAEGFPAAGFEASLEGLR